MLKLDDVSIRTLQVIRDRGVVSGRELVHLSGYKVEDLVKPLMQLCEQSLVKYSGNPFDQKAFQQTYFTVLPSATRLVDYTIKSSV